MLPLSRRFQLLRPLLLGSHKSTPPGELVRSPMCVENPGGSPARLGVSLGPVSRPSPELRGGMPSSRLGEARGHTLGDPDCCPGCPPIQSWGALGDPFSNLSFPRELGPPGGLRAAAPPSVRLFLCPWGNWKSPASISGAPTVGGDVRLPAELTRGLCLGPSSRERSRWRRPGLPGTLCRAATQSTSPARAGLREGEPRPALYGTEVWPVVGHGLDVAL